MVPKIAARGSSFKGAHQYYGHDKDADTSERVMFFETLNMRTQDEDKAWKVMAYTAMHEEQLKKANDIHWNGEQTEKPVYSFSLAWDQDQAPTHEDMKEAAISALAHRKMNALQAMLYGHNDTDHTHVHVVVNMIHSETGRTADIWHDQLELSEWAEEYEREHGGIRCEQRVENNEKRREGEFVKHRDNAVQDAWDQSKTGQEFADHLEGKGYILARGNKRTVIVDPYGKTMNPTRQIAGEDGKNIKAKMLNERLADLDIEQLKTADEAIQKQADREYIDREAYSAEQDEKNIDAALQADRARKPIEDEKQRGPDPSTKQQEWADTLKKHAAEKGHHDKSYARELDGLRDMDARHDRSRLALEEQLKQTYTRGEQEQLLADAQARAEKADHALGRVMGWRKSALEEAEAYQKNIESIGQREQEQRSALEAKICKEAGIEPNLSPALDIEPEIEPQTPEPDRARELLEDYEEVAAPVPEPHYEPPEYTNPMPDHDHSAEIITSHEPSAPGNDNTPEQEQAPQQEQSRDSGGYER